MWAIIKREIEDFLCRWNVSYTGSKDFIKHRGDFLRFEYEKILEDSFALCLFCHWQSKGFVVLHRGLATWEKSVKVVSKEDPAKFPFSKLFPISLKMPSIIMQDHGKMKLASFVISEYQVYLHLELQKG